MTQNKPVKSKRGFASMDPQKQREISSYAGRRSHELGKAYEFTSETARAAAMKGVQKRWGLPLREEK
jgi:uncharacterized protein